ncbi:hypothetical protein T01_7517 [Trichinella spiralis]|uniref:Uncharacterized protein n=1 Tax=Trichinella spiralis TaxID=6334 RepID=A0A0V1B9H3_TRISP|nr:hypothetical protein T01_7517 [Trichinella spiralis]
MSSPEMLKIVDMPALLEVALLFTLSRCTWGSSVCWMYLWATSVSMLDW